MTDIKLHSHACLEIINEDLSLLIDPWISGPAFLGSWVQFPEAKITPEELLPSAILISHEHSDHFHTPTLKRLPLETPVYFPAFPNRRIEATLSSLGFKNIHPVQFGDTISLNAKIEVAYYEPVSIWNDSILHINVDGFNILNTNDAGFNHSIKNYLPKIDLLCQQFSPGASGYPLCWENISTKESEKIYGGFKRGMISMLNHASEFYGVDFVLPFASYFRLHHPDHKKYDEAVLRNTIIDVTEHLSDSVNLIDLLPGESWDNTTGEFHRIYNAQERVDLFQSVEIEFNESEFNKHYPFGETISEREVENYLLNLQHVPEIQHCEDIQVKLNDTYFNIQGGIISTNGKYKTDTDLTIKIPVEILSRIIKEDMSWDEAHIGYWCQFSRTGAYNHNFWRLLQSPYYKKSIDLKHDENSGEVINLESNVADTISLYPESERVLRRYGLYCAMCASAPMESIAQAGNRHGLTPILLNRLISDINRYA